MDIAPLGFAVDTSPLVAAARAAQNFAKEAIGVADAADRVGVSASGMSAKATNAASSLGVLTGGATGAKRATDGVAASFKGATVEATKMADQIEEAAGGMEEAQAAASGLRGALGGLSPMLQGAAREAGAMAAQMGMGSIGGRLGMSAAMGVAQQQAAKIMPTLAGMTGGLGAVATGVGGVALAYIGLSAALSDNVDRWNSYEQRLANSLGSAAAAKNSLGAVTDVANETGVGVDAVIESFNRFAQAKEAIGATDEQLVQMTETVIKLGVSGGTSMGAMQGAMMQFSQALASGKLNGDELRSIMENMQPLAKAIAEGMGVDIGQLRRMGAEGELTGEKIFKSILAQGGKADEMFATMPGTVERSKARMNNAFDELGANIGKMLGVSAAQQAVWNAMAAPVDALNKAFRSAASEGLTQAETKLKQLEDRMAKLRKQTTTPAEEFNKEFNKDRTKERELEKKSTENEKRLIEQRKLLEGERDILQAAAARLNVSREQTAAVIAKARQGLGFQKGAASELQRLGTTDFLAAQKNVETTLKAIDDTEAGLRNVDRQLAALKANDPFEKMAQSIEDAADAMGRGSGGFIGMWQEALKVARETDATVEQVFERIKAQRVQQIEIDIADKGFSAGVQEKLATTLAAGGNRASAEADAEVAEALYSRLGDQYAENTELVNAYTAAVLRAKAAQKQLADTSEIQQLTDSLTELAGVMGVVTKGAGGYAERKSRFESGMAVFERQRAEGVIQAPAPSAAPTATGGGSVERVGGGNLRQDIVNYFKAKGHPEHVARGVAAGIAAESRNNPNALGPVTAATGGDRAYGYGQHLGSRKRALLGRYGGRASGSQQLDFLDWELRGGDYAGKEVLKQTTEQGVLEAYIKKFMRPAKGKETDGDMRRGMAALGLRYTGGGASTATAAAGTNWADPAAYAASTGQIRGLKRSLFQQQEAERAERTVVGSETRRDDNNELADRYRFGGPEAVRRLQLELEVEAAIKDNDPIYANRIRASMEGEDESKRRLAAEQAIAQLRQSNDDSARRNGVARTGDPLKIRALELELRIEEIRRGPAPKPEQERQVAEVRQADIRDGEGERARMLGQLAQAEKSLAEQWTLLQFHGDELRVQERLLQAKNAFLAAGGVLGSEENAILMERTELLERHSIEYERARERMTFLRDTAKDLSEDIGAAFSGALSSAFRTGEFNAKKMLDSIGDAFFDMLDKMVKELAISPLINMFTQFLTKTITGFIGPTNNYATNNGSTAPITNTALGDTFDVTPFAGGGIVNTPTRFNMGSRTALAGEGPGLYEGILPLKRGADGKLGVQSNGGGGGGSTVQIFDQRAAGSSEAVQVTERETGNGMRQIEVMIRDSVKAGVRSGQYDADNRASYGIGRVTQRR